MLTPWIKIILVALSSNEIGSFIRKLGLPLITGFLVTGLVVGPHYLAFFQMQDVPALRHLDRCALAFIAFAAGAELTVQSLVPRLRAIASLATAILASVFLLGSFGIFAISHFIPWLASEPWTTKLAASLLGGTILVAISPSSAIAVIREVRARGHFTQTILGVTLLLDSVVIVVFAVTSSLAHALMTTSGFNSGVVLEVLFEIVLAIAAGGVLAVVLRQILVVNVSHLVKQVGILGLGYGVFFVSQRHFTIDVFGVSTALFAEPLLICLVAGFLVHNCTRYRAEFSKIIEDTSLLVFVLFFTSTGISTNGPVLLENWGVVVFLLLVRFGGMLLGAFAGGKVAGFTTKESRYMGLGLITQAGISLGLSRESAHILPPGVGDNFASLCIGVIVANTILGPGMLKFSLGRVGESQEKKAGLGWGRFAVLFGVDAQSTSLAKQLASAGWKITLADVDDTVEGKIPESQNIKFELLKGYTREEFERLKLEKAGAVVLMEEGALNSAIYAVLNENYPEIVPIVRLHDASNYKLFAEKGAMIVDPGTATVSLLNYLVRSPRTASLLLGEVQDKEVADFVVSNKDIHRLYLRDLDLPSDLLVLAVSRRGKMLLSHGYTRIKLGDRISVVGSRESLLEAESLFLS
jgi:Kef-type K+ transport system membrane component KefB/Trk K+ transport system NAD-binding subunit